MSSASYKKSIPTQQKTPKPCLRSFKTSQTTLNVPRLTKLKDYLNKEYRLVRSVKYDQFLQELGADKPARTKAAILKPITVLTKNGDEYVLTTKYPEGKQNKIKFKIGVEIRREKPDGKYVKSVFDVKANKLIERQEYEGKEILIVREFTKEDLMVSMEVGDVKCYRYYKPVISWHSIGTETSRRNSLFKNPSESEVLPAPTIESVIQNVPNSEADSDEELCL